MITVTATDIQNNFGHYLQVVQSGDEIIISKNGKEVARMIPRDASVSFLTDSLTGILKHDYDEKAIRAERITAHENFD
ncbi:MAG: type II toxin-antitoxin system prevent-host-death family antitoxin [Treponema sp.]|nr:type II toxin-antitoxin system prevent-host-death family antitoxin [Treponema sp.]MBR4320353.1 type II toxin-antitoxin system prevent-host-death family antitoxin [Oscillospiraceae bacterium]